MRFLNISLFQDNGMIVYPVNYQSEIGDFNRGHLYYNDEKGNSFLLLSIEDADFNDNMIRDNVVEISETEAKTISEAHEVRTETVTDDAKVRRLTIKASLGQAFTVDELKAIDPDDPMPGFGRNKILADTIDDLKTMESVKVADKIKIGG
jgi:hypothetical protein